MKNVILFGGIAIVLFALSRRKTTGTVTVSDPVELPSPDLAGSSDPAGCGVCDTVSKTLGTDSRIGSIPQSDSPSADPVLNYAIERMDFQGSRLLSV